MLRLALAVFAVQAGFHAFTASLPVSLVVLVVTFVAVAVAGVLAVVDPGLRRLPSGRGAPPPS